jgi:hypothetical protein
MISKLERHSYNVTAAEAPAVAVSCHAGVEMSWSCAEYHLPGWTATWPVSRVGTHLLVVLPRPHMPQSLRPHT